MIPLIVDLETEWRGGQNQALLLLKGLYERGHAAELVTAKSSPLGHRAKRQGIYVHYVPHGVLRIAAAHKIRSLLREGRFDLVHANESHAVTAAWLARAQRMVPFVISRRVGYPLRKSRIAQARYQSADRIVANSRWVAEQAAASGAPKSKLRIVHEGTVIPELPSATEREQARRSWGVPENTALLGCVGVLLPDKGQEWLIRALVPLRKEFPNARLLLAGDGTSRNSLVQLTRNLGLEDAVIFAGFVKDVDRVYAALDIFLLPSFFEALNNSLLMAMGYQIPSIAFRKGALTEIIEDGVSGLIVSGPDVEEICAAAARLLRDPDLAAKIGRAGRIRVKESFSADAMVENMLQVYEDVLGTDADLMAQE